MATLMKPIQQDLFRAGRRKPTLSRKKKLPRRRQQPNEIVAFFGEGVECKGKIKNHGTIRVDGRFEGEINTKGSLLVGSRGEVTAKVRARTVVSEGKITGDIVAKDQVKLLGTAYVYGSLHTPQLFVADGVTLLRPWTLKMKKSRISARHIDSRELKIVESAGVDQEHLLKK